MSEEFTTEGLLEVWSLAGDRTFVFISHVAGVVALKENGPTRLLFSGGGHYDITGSAEFWRLTIEIAQLKAALSNRAPQS